MSGVRSGVTDNDRMAAAQGGDVIGQCFQGCQSERRLVGIQLNVDDER